MAGWLFGLGIGLPFFVGGALTLLALLVALPRIGLPSVKGVQERDAVPAALRA